MKRDPAPQPPRNGRYDSRFVAPRYRDKPSAAELYAEGMRREGRIAADNRRHDAEGDVDLQAAAQEFVAIMARNRARQRELNPDD